MSNGARMNLIKLDLGKTLGISLALFLVLLTLYMAVFIRMPTFSAKTILDYDPWWFYRHAKEILDNNFQVPKWDLLSFYPPGRPAQPQQGWSYIMIALYEILSFFTHISFMDSAKLAPVIMSALTVIPAFFLGKMLSNKWGGILTAIFATLSPTFIGVSMAGYCDTDAPVVFFSFLCAWVIVLAIKKKKILFYALAVLLNVLFIYTWYFGWYILFFFSLLIPALFVFRLLEDAVHEKKLKLDIRKALSEVKGIAIPILIMLIATNIVIIPILGFLGTIYSFIVSNLGFIFHTGLLVNVSVAELQTINILTSEGFQAVVSRIGFAPTVLTLIGLPLLVVFKIYKKIKIDFAEIFMFLWALLTFYMILNGVRFSLQFSIAASVAAGYVIGNMAKYLRKDVVAASLFGVALLLTLIFVSNAIQMGYSSAGMEVDDNWINMLDWLKNNADKNALVATWWDPGHIIAGYTGLHVHADGAHCSSAECVPYNHNVRIQDMGRMFTTSDENETISLLKKYLELTPEQQQQVKQTFGSIVPDEAFTPVSEVYMIASSDLIGKYYWMSYFGTGTGRNFFQLSFSSYDQTQGIIYYSGEQFMLVRNNDQWVPVVNIPDQGVRNMVIKEVVYYENGEKHLTFENTTNTIDGMLWVDSTYSTAFFMVPEIRDSVFTKMFFFSGEGLSHFELVYSNSEIRLFKVIF